MASAHHQRHFMPNEADPQTDKNRQADDVDDTETSSDMRVRRVRHARLKFLKRVRAGKPWTSSNGFLIS